ncbi:hypothetical protein [Ferrimonas marina]|nr:hypothetical protein [Ferrimonas marina]
MMFFTASPNVARRYGNVIIEAEIDTSGFRTDRPMTPIMWLSSTFDPDELTSKGTGFVISTDPKGFDWPADTLAIWSDCIDSYRAVPPEELAELDDGLPYRYPASKDDRGWLLYVNDLYDGDEQAWLKECAEVQALNSQP